MQNYSSAQGANPERDLRFAWEVGGGRVAARGLREVEERPCDIFSKAITAGVDRDSWKPTHSLGAPGAL